MAKTAAAVLLSAWLGFFCARVCAAATVDFDGTAAPAAVDGSLWNWLKEKLRKAPAPPPATPRPVPDATFKIVSWNLQTYGKHIKAQRKRASAEAIDAIFRDAEVKFFAAQEIADEWGAGNVMTALENAGRWTMSFERTADAQNNGFFAREGAQIECSAFLFEDRSLSRHPARAAHVRVGDLDFTVVTLHLAYDHGMADGSTDELRRVLDWVRANQSRPGADPDVLIAGDFNLPTRAGKAVSERAHERAWTPIDDVLGDYPDLKLTPLVDEPTSRSKGEAANNYDHFIVSKHLMDTAFVAGSAHRMPQDAIKAVEVAEGVEISDHFPISARLRSSGAGNDGRPIRLDGQRACPL